eukprot:3193784-Rhodomonas_salina.1
MSEAISLPYVVVGNGVRLSAAVLPFAKTWLLLYVRKRAARRERAGFQTLASVSGHRLFPPSTT